MRNELGDRVHPVAAARRRRDQSGRTRCCRRRSDAERARAAGRRSRRSGAASGTSIAEAALEQRCGRRPRRSRVGRQRGPATARSSVVFPEPDAPEQHRDSRRREAASTSRLKSSASRLRMRADERHVQRRQPPRAFASAAYTAASTTNENTSSASAVSLRRRRVQRLHIVIDRDRNRARDARQVAADHQHDAELADRVREAQDGAGDDARRTRAAG